MGSFSLVHWIVVIVILLLVFGPKRLSEVGKGLGQGIRNFKKGIEGGEGEDKEASDEEPKRLKKGDSTKKLKSKRPVEEEDEGDDAGEEEEDEEEEEVRPRKKSKRA
jgi:sec-independent protein translocase protein TatA